jgi:hypothetical protein
VAFKTFSGINFKTIHLEKPPFIPNLKSETDTRYFEEDIDANPLPLPGGAATQTRDVLLGHHKYGADILETRKKHAFVGYTFKSPRREVFDPRRGFLLQSFNSGSVEDAKTQIDTDIETFPTGPLLPTELVNETEENMRRMSI